MALDFAVSAVLPFYAVWAYEFSNWVVLVSQGSHVSMSFAGWIPIGVIGFASSAPSSLTKVVQILVAGSLLAPSWVALTRTKLWFSKAFLLGSVAIVLASALWEMLSYFSPILVALHVGLFVLVVLIITFLLISRTMAL